MLKNYLIAILLISATMVNSQSFRVIYPFSDDNIITYNEDYFVIYSNNNWVVKNFKGKTVYIFEEDDISYIEGSHYFGEELKNYLTVRYNNDLSRIFNLKTLKYINRNKYYLHQLDGYYKPEQRLIRLKDIGEGIMDLDGRIIIEPIFTEIFYSKELGIKITCDGIKTAAYDLNNKLLWSDNYSAFQVNIHAKQIIFKKERSFGIAKLITNKIVGTEYYDEIHEYYNVYRILKSKKFGLLSSEGEVLLNPEFKSIGQKLGDNICIENINELWAIYNLEERKFVSEFKYDGKKYISSKFGLETEIYNELKKLNKSDTLIEYEENGKLGLKDQNEKIIIPPDYEKISTSITYYHKELVEVYSDSGIGYYNIELSKEVVPTVHDYSSYHGPGSYISTSNMNIISVLAPVKIDGMNKNKLAFYTKNGVKICDPIYDPNDYPAFVGDLCSVSINNKYGLIDINNQIVIPFEYDYIDYPIDKKVIVKKGNQTALFELVKE